GSAVGRGGPAGVLPAGRNNNGYIDADGIHPSPCQRDVALHPGFCLLHAAHRVAHHASAHVLIADAGRQHADALCIGLACAARELLQHGVIHEIENFPDRFAFVVMGIHVNDRKILVAALGRLLGCMSQQLAGVEFLDLHATKIAERKVHYCLPDQACHMPSSNTWRLTALSMAVTVTITSVAVAASEAKAGRAPSRSAARSA